MKSLKYALPTMLVIGGLTVSSTVSFGKAEYTRKEKKTCVYCHTKSGAKELNKVGECYKEKKTLAGCEVQ